jgi:ATP-dependent Lon protease
MEQKLTPVFLTDNFFLFPFCNKVLNLEDNKNLRKILISSWKNGDGKIVIISSRNKLDKDDSGQYSKEAYFDYGSLVKVEMDLSPDADIEIIFNSLGDVQLIGLERVKILKVFNNEFENVWKCNYEIIREDFDSIPQNINNLVEKFVQCLPNLLKKTKNHVTHSLPYLAFGDFSNFVDFVVQNNESLDRNFKQVILEEPALEKRLKLLLDLDKKNRKIQLNISTKINEKIIEEQKKYFLKEQLSVIKSQIDEIEGAGNDDDYLKRLENEPFPENVKKVIREEIKSCAKMPSQSSEAHVIRSHIEWLMSIPWYQITDEKNDLEFAQQELDKEHFGLEKVKERIIEHLAVIKRTKNILGNVICFIGPPGVGKTSLASSIARATGRNFVRISVGGISDEGEIRGHRKTYVGASPGKIIQGMKKAKVINPLFLIDEIDKIGSGGFHGDPLSALLEILDPSQNNKFMDNYLGEIPYDLSKVLFICTANSDNLPRALLDRMEIIYLSSYTELEKLKIAKNYLVPKNLKTYNFTSKEISFTDDSIREIIRSFTQESGVRNLNRMLQKAIRKFSVEILKDDSKKLEINLENIQKYFGKKVYQFTFKQDKSEIGVVTGLAYTYFGGDVLPIEVNYFSGKGDLILTGTLGKVMKESAKIALDYVKSNFEYFEIDQKLFSINDIHVHVPEGATPKDGPSAGIALTTAIISALTGKKVSTEFGMTGEITLRGHILAIGGLREKSIAANRSGLKTIAIPENNDKDLEDIPLEIIDKIKIISFKNYKDLWKNMIENKLVI